MRCGNCNINGMRKWKYISKYHDLFVDSFSDVWDFHFHTVHITYFIISHNLHQQDYVGSLENETQFLGIMISILSRLSLETKTFFVYPQWWDWEFFPWSLNVESETETYFWLVYVWRMPNVETETKIIEGYHDFIQLKNTKKLTETNWPEK